MLSLHLPQNCGVSVNTLMLQQVLARPHWAGRLTDGDRKAFTPLIPGNTSTPTAARNSTCTPASPRPHDRKQHQCHMLILLPPPWTRSAVRR